MILSPGVEPHSYESTLKDIAQIKDCDLFVYTGDNMEPWVKNLIADDAKFEVVDASMGISFIEHTHSHGHDHDHEHDHGHDHDHEHSDD